MGYRDDFYIVENIVGYTGNLHQNPTVYFYIGGATSTFGHITQAHTLDENVGREKVITDDEYVAGNITRQGHTFFFEEWSDGQHPSRTPMVFRAQFGANDINVLAQAIRNPDCTHLKKVTHMSNTDKTTVVNEAYGGTKPTVAELVEAFGG